MTKHPDKPVYPCDECSHGNKALDEVPCAHCNRPRHDCFEKSSPNASSHEPTSKVGDSEEAEVSEQNRQDEVGGQTGEGQRKDFYDDYHEARDEAHRRTMESSVMGTIKHYYEARHFIIKGKHQWKVVSSR